MTRLELTEIMNALGYSIEFNRKQTKFTATHNIGSKFKGTVKSLEKFISCQVKEAEAVTDDGLAIRKT